MYDIYPARLSQFFILLLCSEASCIFYFFAHLLRV
jgi:hypothetical protein